ncbi:hypothetical protein [Lentzea nigeriaca]|uniref:hypothetical protein n=1 Tax=Lentzea nigeriaca TaxID=1128665 RepID=UPI00195E58E3|nr:hypothetical protein [Lentzea nigeriaca]MBM7858193.1 hypothetical protein [Lentzea nigeriaca]
MNAVGVIRNGVLGVVAGGIAGAGLHWSWGWVHSPYCTSKEVRFCDIETDVVLPFLGAVWALVAGVLLAVALVLLNRRDAEVAHRFGCLYWFLPAAFFALAGKSGSPAVVTALLVATFAAAGVIRAVE